MYMEEAYDKVRKWLWAILWISIAAYFTKAAFFSPTFCTIDSQCIYCALRPLTFFDKIGVVGIYFGCLYLSGLWSLLVRDEHAPPLPNWPGFVLIAFSFFLIYIF